MDIATESGVTVERITSEKALSGVEEDWNRLTAKSEDPNVFMTFEWFQAWNHRFTQDDHEGRRRLCVLALKQDSAVAGISPLIHRTASGFGFSVRKVEFLGGHADYNDLVLGNDLANQSKAVVTFLTQTQAEWDLVDLRDLRETGNSLTLIKDALAHTELLYRILPEKERYLYLPLDAPWAEMVNRLSRNGRQTLRKKQRRLERMGLTVRIIENPEEEPGLLEKLTAIEKQKTVRGAPSQPLIAAYPEVFQSLFHKFGPRGWLYLALMETGGRAVAWRLGFRCGRRLWDYSTAYDPSFSHLSPGMMLIPAILDYGFSHGYNEHDFLRGEESYKFRWANESHQTYRLMIWSRRWTSRARAALYLDLKARIYSLFGHRI